ncbi:MAG: NUDIX domain-containing protein [Haloarculaceae archaeon]
MTANTDPADRALEPLTDVGRLRHRDDVSFHREEDTVPATVVDEVADLPDLASVGITNEEGELLCRRLTETCSWKIPTESVAPGEDFAAAIREHVPETLGFRVEVDALVGVWEVHLAAADGDRTATRTFVTFEGSPADARYEVDAGAADDPVEEAGWFAELPEDADRLPGTDHFLV